MYSIMFIIINRDLSNLRKFLFILFKKVLLMSVSFHYYFHAQ